MRTDVPEEYQLSISIELTETGPSFVLTVGPASTQLYDLHGTDHERQKVDHLCHKNGGDKRQELIIANPRAKPFRGPKL